MFRALLFAIKIGLLTVAAFWVAQRPGYVQIQWLDYDIKAHVGLVLLALLVLLLFTLLLHRFVLSIGRLPKQYKQHREHKKHEKGYQELTQGLTAVAAGDEKAASDKAKKMRALWPDDKGLSLLLEAQAARLRGEEDVAQSCFDKLLTNKDTAFLGLRGLLVNAMEKGNGAKALALSLEAEKLHPRQPWIVQMVYELALQERQWELAEKTLKKAGKLNLFNAPKVQSDRVAILLARADEEIEKGDKRKALSHLKAAHNIDRGFVPAAQRLASYYIEAGKKSHAKPVIQEAWKAQPHKDLVPLWDKLAPENKKDGGDARLRWFEKLIALRPDSPEAQLAAGRVALEHELWGEARQYLHMAETLEPSAAVYRSFAALEERLGHTEEANAYLEKGADAPGDKVWLCKQTGNIYQHWSPIALPHGSFNTIIWDYPRAAHALSLESAMPQNELLITAR